MLCTYLNALQNHTVCHLSLLTIESGLTCRTTHSRSCHYTPREGGEAGKVLPAVGEEGVAAAPPATAGATSPELTPGEAEPPTAVPGVEEAAPAAPAGDAEVTIALTPGVGEMPAAEPGVGEAVPEELAGDGEATPALSPGEE